MNELIFWLFYETLFALLSFFALYLYCLSVFDLPVLIAPLVFKEVVICPNPDK